MDEQATLNNLYKSIFIELGGSSIDRELTAEDYSVAFDNALRLYRARSRNSVQEGWILLKGEANKQVYQLPEDVDNVTSIRRLRFSVLASGGSFDPFVQTFFNSTLRGTSGNFSGLLSYQTISMYEKTVGRLFAEEVMFEHNNGTGELFLWHKVINEEIMGLHVSKLKDIQTLLRDHNAYRWLKDYTMACVKITLGEKYRKFKTVPGAQGGTTLTSDELVSEGKQAQVDLKDEIEKWGDGGFGPTIHIG